MYRLIYLILFSMLFFINCKAHQDEGNKELAVNFAVSKTNQTQKSGSSERIHPLKEVVYINVDTILVIPSYLSGMTNEEVANKDRLPLITSDGGESWKPLSPQVVKFTSINFCNALQGWLVNEKSELWKTEDGGVSWLLVSKVKDNEKNLEYSQQVKFIDELNGGILGLDSLWLTKDGGYTWFYHAFPYFVSNLFFQSGAIWVSSQGEPGRNNLIYKSQDGGQNWENFEVPNTMTDSSSSIDIKDLFFLDKERGWLANTNSIYRTQDGGKNWQKQRLFGSDIVIESLSFINEKEGWASGWKVRNKKRDELEAILLHTMNAGDTWQLVRVEQHQVSFDKVYFGDSQNGWVVAKGKIKEIENASIYRTYDGGKNWKKVLIVKSPYDLK